MKKRVLSLILTLCLLLGLLPTAALAAPAEAPAVTVQEAVPLAADSLTVEGSQFTFYPQGDGFNISCKKGDARTGFSTYQTYLTQDDGKSRQAVRYQSDPFALQNSLTVEMKPQMVCNDQYVKLNYTVKNNGSTAQSFQLATSVMVCFGSNNYTYMVGLPGGGKGIVMNDSNYVLNLLAPSCDTVWYGHDFQRTANIFNNNDNNTVKTPYQCNSMSWSWKKTVQPGQSWSGYVLIGLGEMGSLPISSDVPSLTGLANTDLIAGGSVPLSGTAKTGDTVYLTVDGKDYSTVASGGKFSVNVSLPEDYVGDTAKVAYYAVSPQGSVSQLKEATLNVLHNPVVVLSPTSTTVLQDESLNEAWYQSFIRSSGGKVTHTTISTATTGNKTVTYTAKTSGYPDATANLAVTVLPKPAQLGQTTAARNGKNFDLKATMVKAGGQTYSETGFVYGSFQNPNLNMYDGKATTSTVVNSENGILTATATGLLDGVTYYARAYAKTADGTVIYGPQSGGFGLDVPSYGTFHVKHKGNGVFTIYRDGGSDGIQKVYYRTVNGSAVGMLDGDKYNFRHVDGVLTFNQGETSKDVTVKEFSNHAQYDSYMGTQYSNADRTYQMEINKVEGGAVIDQSHRFAQRNMGHDGNYTVDRDMYNTYNFKTGPFSATRGDYDSDHLGWEKGNKGSAAEQVITVTDVLPKSEYWKATASEVWYKYQMKIREIEDGYQNMQVCPGGEIDLGFGPYQAGWTGTAPGQSGAKAIYAVKLEHGGSGKNTTAAQYYFPDGSGTNPSNAKVAEVGQSGDHLVLPINENQVAIGYSGSGNGKDTWGTSDEYHYFRLNDTKEPQLVDVAYMARSASTTTYLPGDPITISLIFDEIVDETNSKAAGFGSSSYITLDGWESAQFKYAGGLNTNVLYFTGTIPEGAPTKDGNLTVILNCAAQIKDMCDTEGTAPSAGGKSSTAPISSKRKPIVTVEPISNSSGTLTSEIMATNAAKLEYVWSTSSTAPAYGWKSLTNKAGETVTTRQKAGTWYLYARATNEDGLTATASKSYTIPTSGAGALVLPTLTASVDNSQWARSRDITVTPTPSNAKVTCIAGNIFAYNDKTHVYTVLNNGSYTFQINVDGDTATATANVTRLDRTGPTVSFDALDNTKTYMEPVTLTVRAEDGESGFYALSGRWRKTGGPSESAKFTKVADGVFTTTCPAGKTGVETWTLEITAEDNVKNESTVTSPAYQMDYRTPTITTTLQSKSGKGDVYRYTVAQGGSPIVSIQLPDGSFTTTATGTVILPEPGTYYIFVSDKAGHVVRSDPMKVTGSVDGVAPVVRLYADTEWTNQDLTVEAGVSETGSKPPTAAVQGGAAFSLTESTLPDMAGYYEGSFTVGTNGTYTVTATDKSGNVGTAEIEIRNIDKEAPTIGDPKGNPTYWTPNDATIRFDVSDGQSGVKTVVVKKGETAVDVTDTAGSYTFTADSNGTYTVTATDNVGNVSTQTVEVTMIDKTTPELSVTGGMTAAESLELTVKVTPKGPSPVTTTVKKDDGAAEAVTDGTYTVTQAGAYEFTAVTSAKLGKNYPVDVYNVTFDVNGGAPAVDSLIVRKGGKVTEPTVSKVGYTLSGWKNGASAWDFGKDTVTADATLTAQWVITPAQTPTVTGPDSPTVTYGYETAPTLTVSAAAQVPDEEALSYQWYSSATASTTDGTPLENETGTSYTVPTGLGAGSYYYYCVVTATRTDNNETAATTSAVSTVTVDKAASTITAPTANTLTYNGTAQELVTAGSSPDGVIEYSLDGVTYSTAVPTATDAGDYTVYYKEKGDANHADTEPVELSVTVAPKPIAGSVAVSGTPTMAQTLTAAYTMGNDPNETVTYQWYRDDDPISGATESTYAIVADDVGHAIKAVVSGAGNYGGSASSQPTAQVEQASSAVTVWPTAGAITYGDTLADSTLTGGTASMEGTFAWKDPTIRPAVADSDTTAYDVVFTPGAAGYSTVEGKLTLTVNKANPVVSVSAIENLTYNTSAQALVTGTTSGGELWYSLDGTDYKTDLPTGTDAGTYTVSYKVIGGANFNDVDAQTVTVSIARKPITGDVTISGKAFVEQALTAEYTVPGETVAYQWYRDGAAIDGATEGAYTVAAADLNGTITVTVSGTGNYTGAVTSTATDTVGKTLPVITAWPTAGAITYGQSLADSALTGGMANVEGTFTWTDASIRPAVPDSDKTGYSVTFTPTDTASYSSLTGTVTVTVYKADPTVTAPTANTLTYDGTAQALVAAGNTTGGEMQYSLDGGAYSTDLPAAADARDYTVFYQVVGDDNYNDVPAVSLTVTIAPKPIAGASVTLGESLTYNQEEQEQKVDQVEIDGLEVTYDVTNNTGTDAKTYTLTVTGTGNFTGSVDVNFSIAKAGNSISNFTCGDIIHGETPDPSAAAEFGEIVYTYSRNGSGPFAPWSSDGQAGTWYVKAGVADTDNYAGAEQIITFREAAQRETVPTAEIEYPTETLTGLAAGTYTITPAGSEVVTVTVAEGDVVNILEAWFGKDLSIVTDARDENWSDSLPLSLTIPARPAAPAIQGVNETIDGEHDGQITGLTAGPDYQISDDDGGTWTDAAVADGAITGLAPETYQVRVKATETSFAGVPATVTVATGEARTYTLNLTVPTFDAVAEGYDQPEAKAITITSSGNSDSTVYSVEADAAIFTIGGEGETVPAGGAIKTWTIQPNADLQPGVYTSDVTVTYNDDATVTAQASFTVNEAIPDIQIDYENETLTGFEVGETYLINDVEVTSADGTLPAGEYMGKTLSIVKKGGGTGTDSAPQELEVPARPSAPTGPKVVHETIVGKADGKIIGIDETMQYKTDGDWQNGLPDDLEGLPAGTAVTVRSKATSSTFASEQRTLTVSRGRTITVTFNAQGGSPVPTAITDLVYREKATKPAADPAKEGFTFCGWYMEPDCINRWDFDRELTDDLTLYAKWAVTTCSISGLVDEEGNPVNGAEVRLVQGKVTLQTVNTGSDGTYRFDNVVPGDYNVVAEKDGKTTTILVTIADKSAENQNLPMPADKVNSILKVEGAATPDVVVGGLDREAKDNKASGSTVTVTMTVESKGENDGSISAQVTAIKETAQESTKLEYLEIDVKKTVETNGSTSETPITDTQELLEIIIPFDFTGKKNVKVYRYHGSGVDEITQTPNADQEKLILGTDRITLYVRKFSTYAIGYAAVHTVTAQNDGHGTASASPASAIAGTEITLTATPHSGYRFQSWQVVSGNVTISGSKFTMPDEDVTVKAIFAYVGGSSSGDGGDSREDDTSPGNPTIQQPEHGKIETTPAKPEKGDKVKVTVTPDDGYEVEQVIVTDKDGKPVAVTKNPDGTYAFTQPKGKVTVSASLKKSDNTSYTACPKDRTCPIWPYTDASTTAWYHDGVHYCIENGLMNGYGDNKFGPDDTLTRGMLAQILYNKKERPAVSASNPFDDVAGNAWYAKAVIWGAQNGVLEGYGSGKFGPDDPITREQLAVMLWRYAGSPKSGETLARFTDGGMASSWAAAALRWAVEQGIMTGKGGGILDPQGQATRAEAAAMIQRYFTLHKSV